MTVQSTYQLLSCCIEGPPGYRVKARYALRMLLAPFRFDPRPASRDDAPALYYGPGDAPNGALALPFDDDAPAYFDRRTRYDPERAAWKTWDAGERWPVLFGAGDAPDLVASAFFWLAGWQEHVARRRDEHGRFPYEASLQARWDLARRPVVDAYRERLADRLREAGLAVERKTWDGSAWAFCPTHDIDYPKKWRPGILYREVVHYALQNRRGISVSERADRLLRVFRAWMSGDDPFREARSRLFRETNDRGGRSTFFLKAGATSERDVPYRLDEPLLQREIAALREAGFEIGLHPSYGAHTNEKLMRRERDRLREAAGARPTSVRQHYLRHEMPATTRLHERLGFRIDSSLGFSTREGFRHGTCLPFQPFDIPANEPLDVWELPLALMDGTLFTHRNLDAAAGRRVTRDLMRVCRRYGGVFVGLWHNTAWDSFDHPLNGPHFEETLDAAREEGAFITSLRGALAGWE
jgi:hypothetical protein